MSELNLTLEGQKTAQQVATEKVDPSEKPVWEKPIMEDVSEQVMAQPYIRFNCDSRAGGKWVGARSKSTGRRFFLPGN